MTIIKDIDTIKFLTDYCRDKVDLYERFGVRSSEISLLVTYYINQERMQHHDFMLNRLNSTYGLYADTDSIKKVMPEWMRRIDNG